ncbi:hypothetical protein ACIBAH_15870 [Streptomyces sp. NPDC051445]|uniref:hypothetical protein n=1 Tax=Streptomyces sp. NPDC051445 TaxID=3365653 RepID=UPI00379D1884
MALSLDQRAHVRQVIGQLPLELTKLPSAPLFVCDQYEAGFGPVLVNLLCSNRNLRSPATAAKIIALLTEGLVYLAAATISGIGRGRVPLTPEAVAGFATALGFAAGDLTAITGIELPQPPWPDDPLAAEMAALL